MGLAATKVAQNCILPYRGFGIRCASCWRGAGPNAIRRYSRLKICATKNRLGSRAFEQILIQRGRVQPGRCGVRRQSGAASWATHLDRFAGTQSGVALRLPPHSKIFAARDEFSERGIYSASASDAYALPHLLTPAPVREVKRTEVRAPWLRLRRVGKLRRLGTIRKLVAPGRPCLPLRARALRSMTAHHITAWWLSSAPAAPHFGRASGFPPDQPASA